MFLGTELYVGVTCELAFSFKMHPICYSCTMGMVQGYDTNSEEKAVREMPTGEISFELVLKILIRHKLTEQESRAF